MQFSTTFFQSVYLAVALASAVSAAPFSGSAKLRSFQTRAVSSSLTIESFHPESSFETFGVDGVDHPLSKRGEFDIQDATVSFIKSKTSLKSDGVHFRTSYSSDVTQHAYLHQQISGIPVANAVANIAFNKDNKVVSFGHSFVKVPSAKSIPKTQPTLSAQDAIAKAESALSGKYNSHPTTLEWVARKDGSLALTHVVQVQNDEQHEWYEVFVDAHTGEVIQLTDFVAKASYRVLPISKQILTEGFETLSDPANLAASPQGWNYNGTEATADTSGNNVVAYKNDESGTAKESSSGQNFVYKQDPTADSTTADNLAAAITNGFYVVNALHDIATTTSGAAGDRVRVSVQNAQGVDNAYFTTPPDGQPGQMAMFLWDAARPERDGALENDVPLHEGTHGISNRMTGGGTARCLQTYAGMGEGWSDAMAEWTEQKDAVVRDFVLAPPPLLYQCDNQPSALLRLADPHRGSRYRRDLGQYAPQLVYAALVDKLGFDADAHTNASGSGGNTVWLHLFMDSFAIQPCNPTFTDSRDAWIQVDANRYSGKNKCTLWTAFASRGLGVNAKNYTDDASIPADCN